MLPVNRRQFMARSAATLAFAGGVVPARAQDPIRVMALPSIFAAMYERLKDQYLAEQTDSVAIDTAIREDEAAVAAVLRASLIGEMPDILFISPNYLRVFVDRRLAQPLDPFIADQKEWPEHYSQSVSRIGNIDGQVFALGFAVSMPVLLFNSELLNRAGVSELPQTWDEVIAAGQRIEAIGEKGVTGGFMEYDNGGNWTFHGLLNGFGGHILSADGRRVGFDGEEGRQALNVLAAFGKLGQARVDMSRDQARQAFSAGTLGILATSSSSFSAIEARAAGRFKIAMRPFPVPAGTGFLPAAGPVSILLARDRDRQRRAFSFMQFASSLAGQAIMASNTAYLPANDLALKSDKLTRYYADKSSIAALIPTLSKMGPWQAIPGENSVKATDAIKRHLASVVRLKTPVDETLAAMRADVTALLPRS